jgi:hypothetical protein
MTVAMEILANIKMTHGGRNLFIPSSMLLVSIHCLLTNQVDGHVPLVDQDKDFYSTIDTWRGAAWRGRDCDDKRTDVYPGRKAQNKDVRVISLDFNFSISPMLTAIATALRELILKARLMKSYYVENQSTVV